MRNAKKIFPFERIPSQKQLAGHEECVRTRISCISLLISTSWAIAYSPSTNKNSRKPQRRAKQTERHGVFFADSIFVLCTVLLPGYFWQLVLPENWNDIYLSFMLEIWHCDIVCGSVTVTGTWTLRRADNSTHETDRHRHRQQPTSMNSSQKPTPHHNTHLRFDES